MKNIVVLPFHYRGTSFEEIVSHMKVAASVMDISIEFVGCRRAVQNNLKTHLLDDEVYTKYQLTVLSKLMKKSKVEKILFLDFFNLGFDILRYFHEQKNQKVKYGALLHGGTFFENDIYSMSWLSSCELAWAGMYDTVYVGSEYAKNKLPQKLRLKTKAISWGMDSFSPLPAQFKKYDVIFPHRLNPDKGIEEFIQIVELLPGVQFFITCPQSLNILKKNPYYLRLKRYPNVHYIVQESSSGHLKTLSLSKVVLSCAKQETFGYSIFKSILSGCVPVLPNDQCYAEYIKKPYLYGSIDQAVSMIKKALLSDSSRGSTSLKIDPGELSFKKHFEDFFGK